MNESINEWMNINYYIFRQSKIIWMEVNGEECID